MLRLAKKLADTRYSVLQVGGWLFLHGGITSQLAGKYTLGEINRCVRRWLYGEQCQLVDAGVNDADNPLIATSELEVVVDFVELKPVTTCNIFPPPAGV